MKCSGLRLRSPCSNTLEKGYSWQGGVQTPLRPPHLHSPVLLQPQQVFPALGTDTVEDVVWVGALQEREVPSESHCQQEPELHQRGPVLPRKGTGSVCALLKGPGAWLLTLEASSKDTGNQKRRKKACGQ